jgi:hypothetical protein
MMHQPIGIPYRMCRQGRTRNFIQSPYCKLQKIVHRYLKGRNGRFFFKLAFGKKKTVSATRQCKKTGSVTMNSSVKTFSEHGHIGKNFHRKLA